MSYFGAGGVTWQSLSCAVSKILGNCNFSPLGDRIVASRLMESFLHITESYRPLRSPTRVPFYFPAVQSTHARGPLVLVVYSHEVKIASIMGQRLDNDDNIDKVFVVHHHAAKFAGDSS